MQNMERGYVLPREAGMHWQNQRVSVIEVHVKKIQHQLLANAGAKLRVVEAFKKQSKGTAKRLPKCMIKTVALIAAKKLCNKALQLR